MLNRTTIFALIATFGLGLFCGAVGFRTYFIRKHFRAEPRETASRPRVDGPSAPSAARAVATVVAPAVQLAPRADGTIAWEAEYANRVTGTFAVLPSTDTSGGFALWCREGQGKNNTMPYQEWTDTVVDQGIADYYLEIPKDGEYRLYARFWALDKCGNSVWVGFDTDSALTYFPGGESGRYGAGNAYWPEAMYLRWLWIDDEGTTYRLKAGPHRFRIEVREDGVAFDQFALVPVGAPEPTGLLTPTLLPGTGAWPKDVRIVADRTSTRQSNTPTPIDCFFAVNQRLLLPDTQPAVSGWLCLRLNDANAREVTVTLATDGGTFLPDAQLRVALSLAAPLAIVPVQATFPAGSPRRAIDLTATVTCPAWPSLKVERNCRVTRPLDWWALGPFHDSEEYQVGRALAGVTSIDPARPPLATNPRLVWTRVLAPQHYDAFGAVDLNLLFGKQENATAWLATRIRVKRSGNYLVHAGGDDTLRLELDGRRIVDEQAHTPLTASAQPFPVRLEAGDHLLVGRVEQLQRWWQMIVEFQAADGSPTADVEGLPLGGER